MMFGVAERKGKKKNKNNCAITGKQAAGRIHPEVVSTVEEQLSLEQRDRLHVTLQCSGYPRAAWGQEVWFHFNTLVKKWMVKKGGGRIQQDDTLENQVTATVSHRKMSTQRLSLAVSHSQRRLISAWVLTGFGSVTSKMHHLWHLVFSEFRAGFYSGNAYFLLPRKLQAMEMFLF